MIASVAIQIKIITQINIFKRRKVIMFHESANHNRPYRIQHTRPPSSSRRSHVDHHTLHAQVTTCRRNIEILILLRNPLC